MAKNRAATAQTVAAGTGQGGRILAQHGADEGRPDEAIAAIQDGETEALKKEADEIDAGPKADTAAPPAGRTDAKIGPAAIRDGLDAGIIAPLEQMPVKRLQADYILAARNDDVKKLSDAITLKTASLRDGSRQKGRGDVVSIGRDHTFNALTDQALANPELQALMKAHSAAVLLRDLAQARVEAISLRAQVLLSQAREREDF